MHFWQIVATLRSKRRRPPDVRSPPTLGLSIRDDFVAGCAASVLMVSGLHTAAHERIAELTSIHPDLDDADNGKE